MNTLQQIGSLILCLLALAEIVYVGLIPYNINKIAKSLEEISKSLKDK